MNSFSSNTFADVDACVEATLARVGKRIVLGLPVGIGKPNLLVNAFVRRALADAGLHLTIFGALSLRKPRGRTDLERRFLAPMVERVFGAYPELEYVRLLEERRLPSNIVISEFFLEPGAWLNNPHMQQHYLSANYTHVGRDLLERGVNVIAQLVALPRTDDGTVSLSCNPDVTVDLLPHLAALRERGRPFVLIGQIHRQLPYMYGDAIVPRSAFDFIVEEPTPAWPLFAPPNLPISDVDHAIALNAAALVRDGGTLQVGIGELGDAIVYALKLRHEQPGEFGALIQASGLADANSEFLSRYGGTTPFRRGLYGCTEMLVDGFMDLYRAGILRRRVYPHPLLQRLLDSGRISEQVDEEMLEALYEAGLSDVSALDFSELQRAGVFRPDSSYAAGFISIDGHKLAAHLGTRAQRAMLAKHCLGSALRDGVLLHGGFFFGPRAFYTALATLPEDARRQFAMQRISFVNELYGADQEVKIAQRRHARFINTAMMITGLGAAVSDGLDDGRVVSGVGGQYNFVAMAHALPEARSILCVRSTRTSGGRTSSNILWSYGHVTIPRHLRDIVVTEYGIADLRSKTDGEVVAALVEIMDARFQDALIADAKRSGKLPPTYRAPDKARGNTPERIERLLSMSKTRGLFGEFPFGSDFTAEEMLIARALKQLQAATMTRRGRIATLMRAVVESADSSLDRYLRRLDLEDPQNWRDRLTRRVVSGALTRALGRR